jgi:hypothetical protein
MRLRILAGLGVCALALVAARVALAAIPASNGQITGCYTKGGGPLRVVSSASSCNTSTENVLRWNQGPASFDLTVAMSASSQSVLISNKHGLAVSYVCWISTFGEKLGTLNFDPGAGGQATLQGYQQGPTQPGGALLVTDNPVFIGLGISPAPGSGVYEASGTVIANTATNVISIVFYARVDFAANTCTYRGTITAA